MKAREGFNGSAPIIIDWPVGPAVVDVNFEIIHVPPNPPGDNDYLEIDE